MSNIDKAELLKKVEEGLKGQRDVTYYGMLKATYPDRGEIVLAHLFAGRPYNFDNQFARVVQIRIGCGQFGSDMYFLRMPSGKLMTAENQSFRAIPKQHYNDVESHFETDLSYEDAGFREGYTVADGKYLKIGFIIDEQDTPGAPDESFAITIESK